LVGIEIRSEVRPEKREEFLQALESLRPPADGEGGCLSQGLYEARGRPNQFLWVEHWPDQAQVQLRLRSERFRALIGAVRVLGTVDGIQVVEVATWRQVAEDEGRSDTRPKRALNSER